MQIIPKQVAKEVQVDSTTALLKELKNTYGVKDPKIILVFDTNKGEPDEKEPDNIKWKVYVFYNSPSSLGTANLNVDVVLRDTAIMAQDQEVIRTIYPGGWIGWCGKINGQQIWIT